MTDLSLNVQLGARLRGIQQAWGHDSPGETLGTIYDAVINNWVVAQPQISQIQAESGYKVRLRARHVAYFHQMAQQTGCSITELARSFLIQWLCSPELTQPRVQTLPRLPQQSPKQVKRLPKQRLQSAEPAIETPIKPTGRDALRSLL